MRCLTIAAVVSAVALSLACGTESADEPDRTTNAVSAPNAPAAAPAMVPEDAVVLADFEVRADPGSGTLEIVRWSETVDGRRLRTTGQAVWCAGIVDVDGVAGSGAVDSVELFTVDGSVHSALSTDLPGIDACRSAAIDAENPRYDDLFVIDGVFCADVGLRSFYTDTIEDVHITLNYSGAADHAPYQHPYGTGADPDALRAALADAPNDSDGALIAYGDIASGANRVVRWFFKHGNDSPFVFTGQVWFTPTEDCDNGADDDCDGIIDNACRAFADGSDCIEAADCESGVCTDDACQAPTCDDGVENGDETGVDCGGSCADSCRYVQNHWIHESGACVSRAGRTRCWGTNPWMAGVGTTPYVLTDGSSPVVSHDVEFVSMSGGTRFACGASTDGDVHCWGSGGFAPIIPGGAATNNQRLDAPGRPTVELGGPARFAGAHTYHACAVREDNEVFCWSDNPERLGNGRNEVHWASWPGIPPRVALPGDIGEIVQLEIGTQQTGVVTDDGEIYVWGRNMERAHPDLTWSYGDDEPVTRPWPAPLPPATHWVDLAIEETHACALDNAGGMYCPRLYGFFALAGPHLGGNFYRISDSFGAVESIHDTRVGVCAVRSVDGQVRCGGPGWPGYAYHRGTRLEQSSVLAPAPDWIDIDTTGGCAYYAVGDELLCWATMDRIVGNRRTEVLWPTYGPVAAEPRW